MLSELRLVYQVALQRLFRILFNTGASNDRSSSLCSAPLKRVA